MTRIARLMGAGLVIGPLAMVLAMPTAAVGARQSSLDARRTATSVAAVRCDGNVNGDSQVNSLDLQGVALRFGRSTDPLYDVSFDLNLDSKIDALDLQQVALHFGHCPASIEIQVSDLVPIGSPTNGWGPYERNMSNGEQAAGDGHPLQINGTAYARGLGVHANSEISYAVPYGCTHFSAQVGIDDEVAGSAGSATFEAWNSTTARLAQSSVKTGADPASAIDADLAGVSVLRLLAVMGADNAFDHGDWGDAKLACTTTDGVAPNISGVAALAQSSSVDITWATDEIADSRIEYGADATYGNSTTTDSLLVMNHHEAIGGLSAGTPYHYRVLSRDPAGNLATGSDRTFSTSASLFGPPASATTESNAHSVTIIDLNGDTKMDLVTANAGASSISVLLGTGNGTFAAAVGYPTGTRPKSVVLADLNGDMKLDAVTPDQDVSKVSVLLGNGNGTFQPRSDIDACTNAHEATIADLNGDGKKDIACAGWGAPFVGVLLGNGDGTFQPMVSYGAGAAPHSIVAGYFNADAILDLADANHDGDTISVFIGNGNGTFQPSVPYSTGSGPHSLRTADLNGDGKMDLVSANDSSDNVGVLLGNGNGTFQPVAFYATGVTPKGVAIADVDGNGVLDLLSANINGNYPSLIHPGGDSVSVLLGNGDGTFQPKTDYSVGQAPFSVAAGLLNGDNKLDIVTANWWDNGVTIRLNALP